MFQHDQIWDNSEYTKINEKFQLVENNSFALVKSFVHNFTFMTEQYTTRFKLEVSIVHEVS